MEELNGIAGMHFTSKSKGNSSIFMPFTGRRIVSNIIKVNDNCKMWPSSLDAGNSSRSLYFDSHGYADVDSGFRYNGFVVRVVCA